MNVVHSHGVAKLHLVGMAKIDHVLQRIGTQSPGVARGELPVGEIEKGTVADAVDLSSFETLHASGEELLDRLKLLRPVRTGKVQGYPEEIPSVVVMDDPASTVTRRLSRAPSLGAVSEQGGSRSCGREVLEEVSSIGHGPGPLLVRRLVRSLLGLRFLGASTNQVK